MLFTRPTLRRVSWLAALALLLLVPSAADAGDGSALAQKIARAAGIEAFGRFHHFSFTWTHHPSGTERSYAWDLDAHTVTVTDAKGITVVPSQGPVADEHREAHAAFINDSYWALFELHLGWDEGVEFEDLGPQPVPGFDDLGARPALGVQYAGDGGYTPGDRYVLYLADDGLPMAWAFHRGGSPEPSLVTLRGEWQDVHGVQVPTSFTQSDGSAFISITKARGE